MASPSRSPVASEIQKEWLNHTRRSQNVHNAVNKSSDVIKLVSEQKVVAIHKELLCFFSSYHAASLKGKFSEAQKDTFNVNIDAETLENLTTWIYTGDLIIETIPTCHLRLFRFADEHDILSLRRRIMTHASHLSAGKIIACYNDIYYTFCSLPENSPMCRWMVDTYTYHWKPELGADVENDLDDHNIQNYDKVVRDFFYQVMCGMANRLGDDDISTCPCCNACNYHEHESQEEWRATCGQLEDTKIPEVRFLGKSVPKTSDSISTDP